MRLLAKNTKHHNLHLFETDADLRVLPLIVQIKHRAQHHWPVNVLAHVVLLV